VAIRITANLGDSIWSIIGNVEKCFIHVPGEEGQPAENYEVDLVEETDLRDPWDLNVNLDGLRIPSPRPISGWALGDFVATSSTVPFPNIEYLQTEDQQRFLLGPGPLPGGNSPVRRPRVGTGNPLRPHREVVQTVGRPWTEVTPEVPGGGGPVRPPDQAGDEPDPGTGRDAARTGEDDEFRPAFAGGGDTL
jgi:hypothetical protein